MDLVRCVCVWAQACARALVRVCTRVCVHESVCLCVCARVSETIIKEETAMDLREGRGTWRELEVEEWG